MFSSSPAVAPLLSSQIFHEGKLSVRANRGLIGLRRWLTRYFVLVQLDWTLRRYKCEGELEHPTQPPRCYSLRSIVHVRADGASRFLVSFADGSVLKLAGEDEKDTRACGSMP
jgi:hypothetical protein